MLNIKDFEEAKRQVMQASPSQRLKLARLDKFLDCLVSDSDTNVRAEVARQGYGLDKLVYDKKKSVRKEVAKNSYGLDILVSDPSRLVRKVVAQKGHGLDKLISDELPNVGKEVAKRGYGLDILITDSEACVRIEVLRQGYGLDILLSDSDPNVRKEVVRQGYGHDVLLKDNDPIVRGQLAVEGYKNEVLIQDEDPVVRVIAALYSDDKDIYEKHKSIIDKSFDVLELTTSLNYLNKVFSYLFKYRSSRIKNPILMNDYYYRLILRMIDSNYFRQKDKLRKIYKLLLGCNLHEKYNENTVFKFITENNLRFNKRINFKFRKLNSDRVFDECVNELNELFQQSITLRLQITKIVEFGIFVQVKDGLEGLIHLSEISWDFCDDIKNYKSGDFVECKIIEIDQSQRRLNLSIKQSKPDPYLQILSEHEIGDYLDCSIEKIVPFGLFVVYHGISGLVHSSELPENTLPQFGKHFNISDIVKCKILDYDKDKRRLRLSMK